MINSASTILIIFNITFQFLFTCSNANPSSDDKMLIAIMKGYPKIKISDYSKQKYEAHLGILYFMKTNWQCDISEAEFEEYERAECQKYRKYLDILYEYLCREYFGTPTIKPKFVFKGRIEIEGPIIDAVKCLANISLFYFKSHWNKKYEYKLNKLFTDYFELKLLKVERLNYALKLKNEQKLAINGRILQLAIETANEWQTNEIVDKIMEEKFEENLEQLFKKAEERAIERCPWFGHETNNQWIIVNSKFDDECTWIEDSLFSEFVKGLATNFEKFFKLANEYSNYLLRFKEIRNFYGNEGKMINFGQGSQVSLFLRFVLIWRCQILEIKNVLLISKICLFFRLSQTF